MIESIKKNPLLFAMVTGAIGYGLFAYIPWLIPIGDAVGPILPEWLPLGLFLLLYVTFCKIRISELRPRKWHFIIQMVRIALASDGVPHLAL